MATDDPCPKKSTKFCLTDENCGLSLTGQVIYCNKEKRRCDEAPDTDGDGIGDNCDLCPLRVDLVTQRDMDMDGIGDNCDLCPLSYDPKNGDFNSDGLGDACIDTDGDGLLDWEELNIGADGAVTDPEIQDSDGDCLSDGEEFIIGTNPSMCDTDGDGASDGPCVCSGMKGALGIDSDPLDGLGDLPDMLYVEVESMSSSNMPPSDTPSVSLRLSGKGSKFFVLLGEWNGRKTYYLNKPHPGNNYKIVVGRNEYNIRGCEGCRPDCRWKWTKASHLAELPTRFVGVEDPYGNERFVFNVWSYFQGGDSGLDDYEEKCPDKDETTRGKAPTLYHWLGSGYVSNTFMPEDNVPFVPIQGFHHTFGVPTHRFLNETDFTVPFSGQHEKELEFPEGNMVRSNGRVRFSTAQFSNWERVPPRVTSDSGDGDYGEKIAFRIGRKFAEKCKSVTLELVTPHPDTVVFAANQKKSWTIPSGQLGGGIKYFPLKGGPGLETQSKKPNDVEITATCDINSEKISHYKFTVCAHPKNFEIEKTAANGFECNQFIPYRKPDGSLGMMGPYMGPNVRWRWDSDSGTISDLNMVEIWEMYSEFSSSGVLENTYYKTEASTTGDVEIIDCPGCRYLGYESDSRTAEGWYEFYCARSEDSAKIGENDISTTYWNDHPDHYMTTILDGRCKNYCDPPPIVWHWEWINKKCSVSSP